MRAKRTAPVLREGQHWTVHPATGCWDWTGYLHHGYARVQTGQAHREVWRQSGRLLADDQHLHHRCLNRKCVNPDHMEPLGASDHLHHHWDGRGLSAAQLEQIQVRLRQNVPVKQIAADLGLPRTTVNNIAQGRHDSIKVARTELLPARECKLCGEPVPPAKRRSAQFCCVAHRRTYNSRKQTQRRRGSVTP